MNKILLFTYITAAFIIGCSQDQQPIQEQIAEKNTKIEKLKNEVEELRKQLPDSITEKGAVPVRVKEMQPETFNHYIIAFGEVEAHDYALISPEMSGQIKDIHVREGQRVSKGDLLVSLNTASVQSSINQVKANLELARETYEKQKRLWADSIGSEIQYLQAKSQKESLEAQLKNLQAQQRMSQIHAPFSGYVNKIFYKKGELAGQIEPLIEMVNLDRLTVTADISEKYLKDIRPGQKVEITFDSYPDMVLEVPITSVSNVIAKQSRTFSIEINFRNQGEKIKPNMISTIRINDFSADDAFVVPSLIIRQDINGKFVYKAVAENNTFKVQKAYITPGLSYDDQTMIKQGLNENDKVIVEGYNLIHTGVPVKIK